MARARARKDTLKFKKGNDITVTGIRPGFRAQDSFSLRTDHTPKTQIWSYEEFEPEPEERTYWCAICKSKLEYLKGSDTIWRCDNCMQWYDTKIQDSPIKDKGDFKLAPHYDLQHYPTADAEDIPFVQGINPDTIDEEDSLDIEIVRTSADKRVQHIHVKGSPSDALRLVNENDKRDKRRMQ